MAITCASPAYLRQYGEPKTLEELKHHRAVNYVSRSTAKVFPFEFMVDGELDLQHSRSRHLQHPA
ncbi:hypothetical protein EMIT0P253_30292 [Pseudomonas sp. IT-P253]